MSQKWRQCATRNTNDPKVCNGHNRVWRSVYWLTNRAPFESFQLNLLPVLSLGWIDPGCSVKTDAPTRLLHQHFVQKGLLDCCHRQMLSKCSSAVAFLSMIATIQLLFYNYDDDDDDDDGDNDNSLMKIKMMMTTTSTMTTTTMTNLLAAGDCRRQVNNFTKFSKITKKFGISWP